MEAPNPQSSFWKALHTTYTSARRIIIGVIGFTIIMIGILMLVLPGPAFVVIPTGLAILGAEFAFARRWLRTLRTQARNGLNSFGLGKKRNGTSSKARTARSPAAGPPTSTAREAQTIDASSSSSEEVADVTEKHL